MAPQPAASAYMAWRQAAACPLRRRARAASQIKRMALGCERQVARLRPAAAAGADAFSGQSDDGGGGGKAQCKRRPQLRSAAPLQPAGDGVLAEVQRARRLSGCLPHARAAITRTSTVVLWGWLQVVMKAGGIVKDLSPWVMHQLCVVRHSQGV